MSLDSWSTFPSARSCSDTSFLLLSAFCLLSVINVLDFCKADAFLVMSNKLGGFEHVRSERTSEGNDLLRSLSRDRLSRSLHYICGG